MSRSRLWLSSQSQSRRFLSSKFPTRKKEKIDVLGWGWGGYRILGDLRLKDHRELVSVSTSTHFLFTPLLSTVTVGTLESRNILEPVRVLRNDFTFYQAEATEVDVDRKVITCQSVYDVADGDEEVSAREQP